MIPEHKILFLIFSIIRCNNDRDLPSVLLNNIKSLLNILISDFFVVAVDSGISYKGDILLFFVVIIILRFSSYLILCSRCYSIFYS